MCHLKKRTIDSFFFLVLRHFVARITGVTFWSDLRWWQWLRIVRQADVPKGHVTTTFPNGKSAYTSTSLAARTKPPPPKVVKINKDLTRLNVIGNSRIACRLAWNRLKICFLKASDQWTADTMRLPSRRLSSPWVSDCRQSRQWPMCFTAWPSPICLRK